MSSESKIRKAKLKKNSARLRLYLKDSNCEYDIQYPIKWKWKEKRRCFYSSSTRRVLNEEKKSLLEEYFNEKV